jgi:hypothetical protein
MILSDGDHPMALRVDRGGVELRDVSVLPWQTLVISEEDVVPLQGGVALVHDKGDVRIVNRLGRDLRGLVVQVPGRGLHHLPSLADGGDGAGLVREAALLPRRFDRHGRIVADPPALGGALQERRRAGQRRAGGCVDRIQQGRSPRRLVA